MKISFRKLIPVAAALGFAFAASSAQAFTLKDRTNGLASDATTLDWNFGTMSPILGWPA